MPFVRRSYFIRVRTRVSLAGRVLHSNLCCVTFIICSYRGEVLDKICAAFNGKRQFDLFLIVLIVP